MVRLAILLIAAGCGRLGFDARPGPDAGGGLDAPDGGPCVWGPFDAPVRVAGPVVSALDEWSPHLYLDDLAIMFHRYPGGAGGELVQATRASTSEAFDDVTFVAEINTPASDEWTPGVTNDGTILLYAANAGIGFDLRVATRTSATGTFGASAPITELNTTVDDFEPYLRDDGTYLLFASNRNGPDYEIFETTRATTTAAWDLPVVVPLGGEARGPTLSADRRELFFASRRPGGQGGWDIWTARRPAVGMPFAAATAVTELNTPRDDLGVELSQDGTTIYYNRDTLTAGGGMADIWSATRACL